MKISFLLELLLIFVLLAFAASKAIENRPYRQNPVNMPVPVKDPVPLKEPAPAKDPAPVKDSAPIKNQVPVKNPTPVKNATKPADRFCSCSKTSCNCCRNFVVPVLALRGPGCATLQYVKGDNMIISMSFADRVITNTTISGRRPEPVCMRLPGGVSKFCGRVYNIGRDADEFKACLGLELRALSNIEAALRVSCFRFGPNGLKLEPPQPLPVIKDQEADDDDEDEDDDDDDDDFDLDEDIFADDDTEEEEEEELAADDGDADSADYTVFSVFGDDVFTRIFESEYDDNKKPVNKRPAVKVTTKRPVRKPTVPRTRTTTKAPLKVKGVNKNPNTLRTTTRKTTTTTKKVTKAQTEKTRIQNNLTAPLKPTVEMKKTTLPMDMTTNRIEITTDSLRDDDTILNSDETTQEFIPITSVENMIIPPTMVATNHTTVIVDTTAMSSATTEEPTAKSTLSGDYDMEDEDDDDEDVQNFIIKGEDGSIDEFEHYHHASEDKYDYTTKPMSRDLS